MKLGRRSTANWKGTLALTLSIFLISITLASQSFEISTDRESYYPNQDIYLLISGPGNTEFTIKILNPDGISISERKGKTTPAGNFYLKYDGFPSEG